MSMNISFSIEVKVASELLRGTLPGVLSTQPGIEPESIEVSNEQVSGYASGDPTSFAFDLIAAVNQSWCLLRTTIDHFEYCTHLLATGSEPVVLDQSEDVPDLDEHVIYVSAGRVCDPPIRINLTEDMARRERIPRLQE